MKIKEILKESHTEDLGYGVDNTSFDEQYNMENVRFARENAEYYEEIGYSDEETPVFTRIEEDPETNRALDTHPQDGEEQSPGYRGREKAKERSGQPHYEYHEHQDGYIPDLFRDRDMSQGI